MNYIIIKCVTLLLVGFCSNINSFIVVKSYKSAIVNTNYHHPLSSANSNNDINDGFLNANSSINPLAFKRTNPNFDDDIGRAADGEDFDDDYIEDSVLEKYRQENYDFSTDNDLVVLDKVVSNLRKQRRQYEIQLLAIDVAIKRAEAKIIDLDDSKQPLTKGTYDYGFVSKSSDRYLPGSNRIGDGTVPPNAFALSFNNFRRELKELIKSLKNKNEESGPSDDALLKLSKLQLSNDAIWKREESRPPIKAPLIIKIPYLVLCLMLDQLFDGAPISRFYFLETVARMPYFSYITMLHAYETLGWWRRSAEAKRVHFSEEYNEYHHLLIWESLGGDQDWRVRFFAQHSAVAYYFALIAMWIISPSLAYNFSELIEAHAVDTYAEFAEANKDLLKSMEAPPIAKQYYEAADMYIFDEFQTSRAKGSRRPKIRTLYDVVCCIRDDEGEHVKTMAACQDPEVVVRSPNTEAAILTAVAAASIAALAFSGAFDGSIGDSANTINSALGDLPTAGEAVGNAVSFTDAASAAAAAIFSKLSNSGITDAAKDGLMQSEDVVEEGSKIIQEGNGLIGFFLRLLRFIR